MKEKTLNHGITLIALVITIIVLLILAGVSIGMLTGENGILRKTTNAKEKTAIKNAEEIIKLRIIENELAQNSQNQKDYLTTNDLIQEIVKQLKAEGYNVEEDNDTVIEGKETIKISTYLKNSTTRIHIQAPKNSTTTLKSNNQEIEKIEMLENTQISTNISSNIGNEIIAECKIKDEVIYQKAFNLKKDATIKMYPCEENGDGKALYWYGMEFTEFNSGNVKYGDVVAELGTCLKKENSINLYFNDTVDAMVGIALNCKQDLTNFNQMAFKIENVSYTGFGMLYCYAANSANDYKETWEQSGKWYLEVTPDGILNGVKNINISNESGEKYINIMNFNPAGRATGREHGSISFDISTIVLK